ncbi:MAG: hypothetical protein ACE5F6_02540 [Anaerolineae bacterium]
MNLDVRGARPLRPQLVLWIALLFSWVIAGCASPATPPPPTPAQAARATATSQPTDTPQPTPAPLSLTIVQTNDTWGYLDPCG